VRRYVLAFIYKLLDVPTGVYYVLFHDASVAVPLKYYRYEREDRRAGGDAGIFVVPQIAALALRAHGIADGHYVRIAVYKKTDFFTSAWPPPWP
jgi:hypothetical protein